MLRKLETAIPSFKTYQFPDAFPKMAEEVNGLILFTGATGTGKTNYEIGRASCRERV